MPPELEPPELEPPLEEEELSESLPLELSAALPLEDPPPEDEEPERAPLDELPDETAPVFPASSGAWSSSASKPAPSAHP